MKRILRGLSIFNSIEFAGPFYSTLPTAASSGTFVSFHTWCWFATWSQQASKQLCSISQTEAACTQIVWIGTVSFLLICFQCAKLIPIYSWSLVTSLSPQSHSFWLADRQGITYRQMNTVLANWTLIHVLNTMFCKEGSGLYNSNYIQQ